ncbi:hypothetical protein [Roseateles sp.]|uniref:hypothetical protein n=1 Tax=Roseateles sp. TaxID=1971397 RepID=UPI0031D8AD7C
MQRDGQYRGISYRVEAEAQASGSFLGRYRLLDHGRRRSDAEEALVDGLVDVVHPPLDRVWATENEALTYATEAACHAIEILQLGRPQAQGRGSGSSERRTDSLGQ